MMEFDETENWSSRRRRRSGRCRKRCCANICTTSPTIRPITARFSRREASIRRRSPLTLSHTLPLTDKTALGQHNDEFLAVPRSAIVDIVLSSGTTGKPTTMMYTENDLRRLAYNEEISLRELRPDPGRRRSAHLHHGPLLHRRAGILFRRAEPRRRCDPERIEQFRKPSRDHRTAQTNGDRRCADLPAQAGTVHTDRGTSILTRPASAG